MWEDDWGRLRDYSGYGYPNIYNFIFIVLVDKWWFKIQVLNKTKNKLNRFLKPSLRPCPRTPAAPVESNRQFSNLQQFYPPSVFISLFTNVWMYA